MWMNMTLIASWATFQSVPCSLIQPELKTSTHGVPKRPVLQRSCSCITHCQRCHCCPFAGDLLLWDMLFKGYVPRIQRQNWLKNLRLHETPGQYGAYATIQALAQQLATLTPNGQAEALKTAIEKMVNLHPVQDKAGVVVDCKNKGYSLV